MRNRLLSGAAAAVLVLACLLSAAAQGHAQDQGYWRAASSQANAITGDIAIGNNRLTINFSGFTMARIRTLKPDEVAAAFDADSNAGPTGSLYRVNVPADKRFLHHNTLCGTDETQWMATYVEGRTLHVTFFSGTDMPVLTPDALANGASVCGSFSYGR